MNDTDTIKKNLESVTKRIEHACEKAGNSTKAVTLIGVTKTFGTELVRRAIEAGITDIGENYVQEARQKIEEIGESGAGMRWHFIGHLQKNKAKYAVRLFNLIHSVDSIALAEELHRRAEQNNKIQDILVQINISHEDQKSGVDVGGVVDLVRGIAPLQNLAVRGLMGMPPFHDDPEESRPYFVTLRKIRETVEKERIDGVEMTELSMGMSLDFAVAVEEGATMVRVGTALFGERS
jgi:pyridoxal phosphate enzyme (YggS family)